MSEAKQLRIELEAANALAHWKAVFADEVAQHAKRRVSAAGRNRITLEDYRQAAQLAIQTLSAEIRSGDIPNADREAA